MQSFLQELKRRNVFRVGAAYLVVSWLIIQLVETIFPAFGFDDGAVRIAVLLMGIGLIPVLILAWIYEMTPEGLKREKDIPIDASVTHATGRKLDRVIVVVLALSVVMLLVERNWNTAEQSSSEQAAATPSALATASASPSIAVLPFDNRSADASDEFFVEGIHDDILTQLAKIGQLKVISRTSVMQYKDTTKTLSQIGRELGVTSVVEGAVQRAGDRVRVTVQLIDATTDEHLWADNYDRELTAANIFAIQSEVAATIAQALEASLTPSEKSRIENQGTDSLAAYEAYTQGRFLFNRRSTENIHPAVEKLETAVALDPNYAAAWAGLAAANLVLPGWTGEPQDKYLTQAAEAARRAIALDPTLGEAHATLADILHLQGHWSESEEAFRKAISVDPNNVTVQQWSGSLLATVGRGRAALEALENAERLDPAAPVVKLNKAWILLTLGRVEEASVLHEQLDQLQGYSPWVENQRALIALREGRTGDVRALISRTWGTYAEWWPEPVVEAMEDPSRRSQALAYLNNRLDKDRFTIGSLVLSYAYLEAWDEIFDYLDSDTFMATYDKRLIWQPELAPVHRDPRFKVFLEQVGLPQYWRVYGWPDSCKPEGESFSCE